MKFYRALQHKKHSFSPDQLSCHHCGWTGDGEDVVIVRKEDYDELMKHDQGECFGNCGDHRIPEVKIVQLSVSASEVYNAPGDVEFEFIYGVCRVLEGVCALGSIEEIKSYVSKNWTFGHDFSKGDLDPLVVEFEGEIISECSDGLVVAPNYDAPYTIRKMSEWS